MAYTKTNWINNTTELNAQNMNHIEDGIENAYGHQLLAVADEAPAECVKGDQYYNKTTAKIYTATGTNTWGTDGEDPEEDVFYVVMETQNIFTYNGQELISVGGGAGGQIAISETEPTEEEILWINPEEETNQAKYKYNGEWQELNIKALDSIPIGAGIEFYGPKNKVPNGFLVCDGSAVSRTTYSDLFALIGTTHGTGDGSTTFNLPNDNGRTTVGIDENDTDFDTLGKKGGSKTTTLIENNIAYHNYGNIAGGGTGIGVHDHTGSYTSFSNLQPYIAIWKCIKAFNTTPTMASIVNGYSTSTQDGYSCDYINDCNTYSTSEVDTGKVWIDGKKIYRKVIDYTGSVRTDNGDNTEIGEITNLEKVIDYSAMIKTGPTIEDHIYISYAYNNISANQWQCYRVFIDDTTKKVKFNVQRGSSTSPRTIDEIIVIVEYTKTTD